MNLNLRREPYIKIEKLTVSVTVKSIGEIYSALLRDRSYAVIRLKLKNGDYQLIPNTIYDKGHNSVWPIDIKDFIKNKQFQAYITDWSCDKCVVVYILIVPFYNNETYYIPIGSLGLIINNAN